MKQAAGNVLCRAEGRTSFSSAHRRGEAIHLRNARFYRLPSLSRRLGRLPLGYRVEFYSQSGRSLGLRRVAGFRKIPTPRSAQLAIVLRNEGQSPSYLRGSARGISGRLGGIYLQGQARADATQENSERVEV